MYKYQQENIMIKNIKDLIVCVLVGGVLTLLGIVIIGDYIVALQENRPVDESVITLMKMSLTGLIGIIAGWMGAKQNNMATKLNENSEVALPLRNIISMIAAVAVATWGYFGIVERLNQIETNQKLMHNDVVKNTEFRIKWPRGEMGSLPADSEQFMLIEHLAGELEKLSTNIENGDAPYDQQQKLTLEFYEKRISKLEDRIEALRNGEH